MPDERWQRIETLFHSARARAAGERAAFLDDACAGDEALRREVDSLLANEANAPGFLSRPVPQAAAGMAGDAPAPSLLGQAVGSYQILSLLGAGGMGEVYRARDIKLGREVAVKILPRAFASDPERLARFAREARVLAALNHPHIAAIHGLEETGGVQALVLELVEGPTLADRIEKGPLPLREALAIAGQVAEALEAAHEKGIVHRDLKPANIKLTARGNAKVLDFGLAKAGAGRGDEAGGENLSQSPTVTVGGTRDGIVLGTAAYMSPEQARGQVIDRRTDIWAFGCVLYEMLSGRAAFLGSTIADTLAGILERSPDWTVLPAATPASIERLLHRCLEKDFRRRQRDIGDARVEIEEAAAALQAPDAPQPTRLRRGSQRADRATLPANRTRLARLGAAAGVLAVAAAVGWYLRQPDSTLQNPLDGATFTRLTDFEGAEHHAAISRDGKFVVFLSDRDGVWDAWVSQVGTGEVHNLTKGSVQELRNPAVRTVGFVPDGSLVTIWNRALDPVKGALVDGGWVVPTLGGALRPYLPGIAELDWSPDGSRIVYHSSTAGDPMFVTGPDEKTGCEIYRATRPGVHNHFQVWSPDGAFIYFVQGFLPDQGDVWRIRPDGGEPERMTLHDSRVTFPTFLDSRTLLYLATADDGSGPWIHALDVERRVTRRVSTGVEEYVSVAASADGRRLVATVSGTVAGLWRVPITDRAIGESGATRLTLPTTRGLSPRIASGYILYRAPKAGTDGLLKLVDGTAAELWSGVDGRVAAGAAMAPNGQHLAFPILRQGQTQLYVTNADGTGARRLAEELDVRGAPAWSPDGQWIAIAANQQGEARLFKIPVDGGAPVRLTEGYGTDPLWSPTGQFIVYTDADVGTVFRLRGVTPDGKPHDLPDLILSRGSRRMAFLPGGDELVVLKGDISRKDFWAVDLRTGRERQLTDFGRGLIITDFDVSPDGREIVFDRSRDESDVVLIDLPAR